MHLVTDWEELIEVLHTTPCESGPSYPVPRVGDIWIIEDSLWEREQVEAAKAAHVHVLLIGLNTSLEQEAASLGVETMLGNRLDPDEIMRWVHEKHRERPKLRKVQRQGTIVSFAGLLPTGGGVGKDTLVINTAAWLQSKGKSVAVVDLDPFGTLKYRLKADTTLSVDVWEERFMNISLTPEMVKNALVQVKDLKFWLLPASTEGRIQTDVTIHHMGLWLSQAFDIVIWNLGSGNPGKLFFAALQPADHVFLVANGDRAKFPVYQRTLEDYTNMMGVEPKILFNKFYDKDAPVFFEDEYKHSVFAYALEDRRVFEINELGKAVALEQPRRPFGQAVQKIGREILGDTGEESKKGGWRLW